MNDSQIDTELQDDLTLRLWDGDDSVKGELILLFVGQVEGAIRRAYPSLSETEAEDVVAEAIRRFWGWREKYDPERAKISTVLYRFADHVASEYRSGRYKWQKTRLGEVGGAEEFFASLESSPNPRRMKRKTPMNQTPGSGKAIRRAIESLPEIQQEILWAYADAGDYPLDAAVLGRELGDKHQNGVPIPAGTIRVYKSRAKETLTKQLLRDGYDLNKMGYLHD